MFKDRKTAGLLVAEKLKKYSHNIDTIVVTIPRGGVPIGYAISKQLHLPLELILSKKIGYPTNKEYAIGAVTLNDMVLSKDAKQVSPEYLGEETDKIRKLLKQRHYKYYGIKKALDFKNKTILLVDDGVATGYTLISSIKLIEKQNPSQIIVALPVAPPETIEKIKNIPSVSNVICLLKPTNFYAVGQFYQNFNQVTDNNVVDLLNKANKNLHVNT